MKLVLARASESEVSLRIDGRWRVPSALTPDRHGRSERFVELPASVGVRLSAGLDRVDVEVEVHNTAEDHRLRLHVRAPFAARRFEVESAFEVVERPIAPAADSFGSAHPAEQPIGAVPQRAFATIAGDALALTVANRGNAEVEAVPEPDGGTSLAVTILRAVGWLSGTNLTLRPMPAGPPFATPGAQVPGRHVAEFGLFFHAPGDPARLPRAYAFAAPPLAFVGGRGDGVVLDGARLVEVDDPHVVVSAIEPAEEGGLTVRLWNASGEPRETQVRVPGARRQRLAPVDLLGEPAGGDALRETPEPGAILTLRPWEIASLRTR